MTKTQLSTTLAKPGEGYFVGDAYKLSRELLKPEKRAKIYGGSTSAPVRGRRRK